MKRIRVLIVDDEIHARRGIKMLLESEGDIEVVGQAKNGQVAIESIRALKPDLVFLDVEMPGLDGIEVIAKVGADAVPAVIFVTAFDQYAVSAFEVHALDYLLKPFSDERFREALDRARARLRDEAPGSLQKRLEELLGEVDTTGSAPLRFTVRTGDVLRVFRAEEIDWIEADEYYAKLHIGEGVYMVRVTMHALDEQLPANRFARIHRSTIVNLDRVVALEPMFQGDYAVILKDGTRLRMSRRRRQALGAKLRHFA